ncbi:MAG: PH domain-containing protein [Actinomycetota bacterium]|nr:PH domain-containing protein [Actinomycetota bacterium]
MEAVATPSSVAVAEGLRPLHPSQRGVWRLACGLAALVVTGGVLAAELVTDAVPGAPQLPGPTGATTVVIGLVAAGLVWWLPRLAYDAWSYELTPSTLELRRGVVVRSHTAIPYFRVQHIDITRSPLERALGLSQLVVRTAAATTDARLPGIAAEDAERLSDVILARTGRDDAV